MEAQRSIALAQELPTDKRAIWRHFLVRDGLMVLSLTTVALVLGGITSFLFRSFQEHRQALAIQWEQQGNQALKNGDAKQAVVALRTSLSFRPDDHDTQLALAQALAASGHAAEAENYYLTLWQAAPGDGLINLQLARLERLRGDAPVAVNYYRAAVFGTWQGDALLRRRDARLELSRYLIERGEMQAARSELLITSGNNPDPATQLVIGEDLELAQDPGDAMTAYRNAMQPGPSHEAAYAKAGELCYSMGNYHCASEYLVTALRSRHWTEEQITRMSSLQETALTLQQLAYGNAISQPTRAIHISNDAQIASERLSKCIDITAKPLPVDLLQVQQRWKQLDTTHNKNALRHDDDLQQQFVNWMSDAEAAATRSCGAAQGTDKLLLDLENHPATQFGDVKE